MKRPHGYGNVVNLGKGRRRPFAVRLTDYAGTYTPDENNQYTRKRKYLGYYETKEAAFAALDKYIKDQGKTEIRYLGITFGEIWNIWAERNLHKGSKARVDSYSAAIKKCAPLFEKRMDEIRLFDLQEVIDRYEDTSKSNLNNIKVVMGIVFEWAIKNDVIQKDYSKFVEINARKVENHIPFTHAEVKALINKSNPSDAEKIIIMYLYTGVRPAELLELKKEDVHLPEQYFSIKKSKTKSGIRMVPIADKILPLFAEFFEKSKTESFLGVSRTIYCKHFAELYPKHTPHDTRTTFISFMTEADVQQVTIQKIVGHSIGNVTGDVYTKLSLAPLLAAVNRLESVTNL